MANNDYYTQQRMSRERAIENITGISKAYFESLCEACSKLAEFRNKLMGNFGFLGALHKSSFLQEADFPERLNHCLCIDAIRCFEWMGIPIEADSEEMLGISLFIAYLVGDDFKMEYDSLLRMEQTIQAQIGYLVLLQDFSEAFGNRDSFILSSFLPSESDLLSQYHILLYRWASLVAKADGVITEQEQIGLQRIISPTSPSVQSNQSREEAQLNESDVAVIQEEGPIEKLHDMIGLASVKQEVETLYNFVKIQQQRERMGLKPSSVSYHCVFTGNPGTGKTTIARIVAQIYKELGILKKGHLVETDRSGLVAEYVGQTAIKTNKIIDEALDGVLLLMRHTLCLKVETKTLGKKQYPR